MVRCLVLAALLIVLVAMMGSTPTYWDRGYGGKGGYVGAGGGFQDVNLLTLGQDLIAGEYYTPVVDFSAGTKYYFDPAAGPGGDGSLLDPFQDLETDIAKVARYGRTGTLTSGGPVEHGDVCVLLEGNHGEVVFNTYYTPGLAGGDLGFVGMPGADVQFDYFEAYECMGFYFEGFSFSHKHRQDWDTPGVAYNEAPEAMYLHGRTGYPNRRMIINNLQFGSEDLATAKTWEDTVAWNLNVIDALDMNTVAYAHVQNTDFSVCNYGGKYLNIGPANFINNTYNYIVGDGMQFSNIDSVHIKGVVGKDFYTVNANHVDFIQDWGSSTTNVLIEDNYLLGSTDLSSFLFTDDRAAQAIFLNGDDHDNVVVRNNVIVTNTNEGITLATPANDCIIANNTLTQLSTIPDGVSWWTWYPQAKFSGAGATNCYVVNNVSGESSGTISGTELNNDEHRNGDFETVGFTSWSEGGDPLTHDFTLTVSSSLVDAGTSTSAPFTDYAGDCRPKNALWDIGAYEYDDGGGCDVTPPAAPTELAAFPGDSSVDLFWEGGTETDFNHFVVYRGTVSGSLSLLHTMSEGEQADYTDNTAVNGTEYFYAVTAVDDSSNESDQSSEASATPVAAALSFTSFSVNSASEAE